MAVKLINRIVNSLAEIFVKGGNLRVENDAFARINGVSDVYLGCPIGTIVMWAGASKPANYFICDGTEIELYDVNRPTSPVQSWEPNFSKAVAQSIQGLSIEKDGIQGLINVIQNIYGARCYYTIVDNGVTKYLEGYIGGGGYTHYRLSTEYHDFPQALSEQDFNSQGFDIDYTMWDFTSHYYIKLPDLRGRFPIGVGQGTDVNNETRSFSLANTGGEYAHKLEANEIKHTHNLQDQVKGDTTGSSYGPLTNTNPLITMYSNTAHNNIPPFLAVNFIIKYQ